VKFLKNILILSVIIAVYTSCNKLENYSDIPVILNGSYLTFKDATGKDTAVLLKFTFTDGDGNVGLSPGDTIPPNDKNLFVDYYEKIDGEFTKVAPAGDTVYFNARINRFGSENPTKADVEMLIKIGFTLTDTIRLDYYIVDRAFNRSNMLSTGPIAVKQQ
jgi:hypothetical protein